MIFLFIFCSCRCRRRCVVVVVVAVIIAAVAVAAAAVGIIVVAVNVVRTPVSFEVDVFFDVHTLRLILFSVSKNATPGRWIEVWM